GEQGEVQVLDLLEQLVVVHRVAADADDLDALAGQFVAVVAEAACLHGAAAGAVGGVEVDDDDLFADVVGRLPGLALVVLGLEGRGRVADLEVGLVGRGQVAAGGQDQGQGEQTQSCQYFHGCLSL